MWDTEDIGALRLLELKDAERVSAALRGPAAQLAHLPPGGFGAVTRRDPAIALLRRRRREDLGLCPYCGSSPDGDTVACTACLAVAAAARRRLKAGRRARGLCLCGARPAPGFKLCSRCLGHAAKRRAANRSRGLCSCGTPATPGYRTCAGCRERATARHARLRAPASACAAPRPRGRVAASVPAVVPPPWSPPPAAAARGALLSSGRRDGRRDERPSARRSVVSLLVAAFFASMLLSAVTRSQPSMAGSFTFCMR